MKISGLNHESQSFILLINVKMPTIVGILTFISRMNFMLSSADLSMKNLWASRLGILETETRDFKPQSHIHGFDPGRATVHPDLSNRGASA